jgi:hypothetical protein
MDILRKPSSILIRAKNSDWKPDKYSRFAAGSHTLKKSLVQMLMQSLPCANAPQGDHRNLQQRLGLRLRPRLLKAKLRAKTCNRSSFETSLFSAKYCKIFHFLLQWSSPPKSYLLLLQ